MTSSWWGFEAITLLQVFLNVNSKFFTGPCFVYHALRRKCGQPYIFDVEMAPIVVAVSVFTTIHDRLFSTFVVPVWPFHSGVLSSSYDRSQNKSNHHTLLSYVRSYRLKPIARANISLSSRPHGAPLFCVANQFRPQRNIIQSQLSFHGRWCFKVFTLFEVVRRSIISHGGSALVHDIVVD